MRYVYLAILTLFSIFARPINAQGLLITNYQLVGQQTVTATQSRMMFRADLVNSGGPLGSVAATVSSADPFSVRTISGQDVLNFSPVPGSSQVTSSNTFTILVTGAVDFTKLRWTFQSTASGPIANAGFNQTVGVGTLVMLNGSASTNPSGVGTLTYKWQFTSRPPGTSTTLFNSMTVNPMFVADVLGNFVITLTVSNGTATSSANVTISTGNSAPVANAGPNQTVPLGSGVTLNGSQSSDVDGNALTYQWTLTTVPPGSTASLTGASTVSPTFTADRSGTYVARLVVNDGTLNSVPANVTITTLNTPPVANPGTGQTVNVGDVVQLSGAASTDVDGDALTYQWSLISKPGSSTATLSNANAVNPSFTVDVAGGYVAQLIVNDGKVNSAAATVSITTSGVQAPTANAGPNQTVLHGATVNLSGSGTDPQLLPLTYAWSLTTRPAGSAAVLSGTTTTSPTFIADQAGTYVAQLIVNNGFLNSVPSTVTIVTTNTPPVANAGPNQTVTVASTVTLNGGGSVDSDLDPLIYSWSFSSRPGGSTAVLVQTNTASPKFLADVAGSYVIQLIVNDGVANSAPTTVTVTAVSPVINLSPNPVNVASGATAGLTLTLSAPAGPGGQMINLTSGNSSFASVPPTVTVLPNALTANVVVTGVNPGVTTITASALGFTGGSTLANVTAAPQIILQPNVVIGPNQTTTFTVTLANAAPSGGVFLSLASSDTSLVTISPTLMLIPEGRNTPYRQPQVTGVHFGLANITASASGLNSATQQVGVSGSIAFLPTSTTVTQGFTTSLTLTLSTPAPATGINVNLSSSNPTIVTVPPSITIPPNASSVSVLVSGVALGSAVIHASSLPILADTTATVTVVPPAAVKLPAFVIVGQWEMSGPLPVSLTVPAPAGGVTVTLHTTDPSMVSFAPTTVFIPGGQTKPATLPQVTGHDIGSLILSASAPGYNTATLHTHVTDQITIGVQDSVSVKAGQSAPYVVCLPGAAPPGGITVTLTSDEPSKLTITPSIFIPEGQMFPVTDPQVTGIGAGTVIVRAHANGFSSEMQTVQVIP